MYAIKTERLSKFYGASRGICEVDLRVERGDFFGFIGPNGAGKSTTIRTLLGLIRKTAGNAEIFGMDIEREREKILAKVGYLPSEVALYHGMRVSDALEFSARLRRADCSREAKILCERLELDTSKRVEELSFGNKKKVGIVCALQHNPELYILDEPTSGLDPLMQREFYNILKERNESGATVFLSSHVLSEVSRYCKSAAVIREGKILLSDKVERLGNTGVKRVIVRGLDRLPKIDGAVNVSEENGSVSFLYSGKADALIKELSRLSFDDINVSDPELDEIFMHFYAREEK